MVTTVTWFHFRQESQRYFQGDCQKERFWRVQTLEWKNLIRKRSERSGSDLKHRDKVSVITDGLGALM